MLFSICGKRAIEAGKSPAGHAGLFVFITILAFLMFSSSARAVVPSYLYFQGRLTLDEGMVMAGVRNLQVQVALFDAETGGNQVVPAGGRVFERTVPFRDGVFEVAFTDSLISKLDYFNNDYYLNVKINLGGVWKEFTPRPRLAASSYAFMAHNLKGGPVYARGKPAIRVGAPRSWGLLEGRVGGLNFGTAGYAKIESVGWRDDGARVRLGTMEVTGALGYHDKITGAYCGIFAGTGIVDPPLSYNSYTRSYYPSQYAGGIRVKGTGTGMTAISTSADQAAVVADNYNTLRRGAAFTVGSGNIQISKTAPSPVGVVWLSNPRPTTYGWRVTNSLAKPDSLILVGVQNLVWEKVTVSGRFDGHFYITRDNLLVTTAPSLEVGYLIIN